MSEVSTEITEEILQVSSARFTSQEKYLALAGSILSLAAFWLSGAIFRIPTYHGFSASLVQQPTLITTLTVTAIVYAACVVISGLITRSIAFDGGVFCACIGLCALSIRGGPMRYTLFETPIASVWTKLIVELVILATFLAGGTIIQLALLRKRLIYSDDHRHVVTELRRSVDQRCFALLANVIVTAALMMLLAQTDRKAQVIGALLISSYLGTLAAYYLVPTRPSAWYWSAPIIVGILGYITQSLGNGSAWQIGQVRGTFAALARPLPLEYAGAGVASAIVGYWMSRRWQHEREISAATTPGSD
jgi:hypothetical protein